MLARSTAFSILSEMIGAVRKISATSVPPHKREINASSSDSTLDVLLGGMQPESPPIKHRAEILKIYVGDKNEMNCKVK
jgi:hypothetical protein